MTPKHCKAYLNDVQKKVLLNREVIAINQDVTPQGFPIVAGDSTVWVRNLSDGSVAVALYNEDDTPKSIGTSFSAFGWASSTKATVRDLWAHTDNGTATGEIANMTVRPHATVVLRLTPVRARKGDDVTLQ
jgi:alpha-galactosidase